MLDFMAQHEGHVACVEASLVGGRAGPQAVYGQIDSFRSAIAALTAGAAVVSGSCRHRAVQQPEMLHMPQVHRFLNLIGQNW